MPLPMDVLLRVQASPVPTQMVFDDCGSMAIAPMDCTASLSKTGLNVAPPLMDFHTPPLAAPTYTVSRPLSLTAAMAATRPLIVAEPIFRAPRPEIVSESNLTSCASAVAEKINEAAIKTITAVWQRIIRRIAAITSAIVRNCIPVAQNHETLWGCYFPAG